MNECIRLLKDRVLLLGMRTNFFKFLFIYLFLDVLGLCCCTQAFSSCSKWGLLLLVMQGFLIVMASLVLEHRL